MKFLTFSNNNKNDNNTIIPITGIIKCLGFIFF